MELEDGFDDILAQINEPSSPKKLKICEQDEINVQAGMYFLY